MLQWLRNLFSGGRPAKPASQTTRDAYGQGYVRGRYDAAQSTAENAPLWGLTDYLSARAANNFQTRRTLKIRSRYECDNNSYFRGMVNSLANDLVGTGPRLQMRSGDEKTDARIEALWSGWCEATGFAHSLRTKCKGKIVDGEGIALLVNGKSLAQTVGGRLNVNDPVQLDFYCIESDQMTTPDPGFVDLFWVDGIVLDRMGKPKEYHVLRHHPGDLYVPQLAPLEYDRWQPRHVCHWFRCDRPGQARGIPEATPALELFAQIRRFTKAVLVAAETAADFAAVLTSEAPANSDPTTDENNGLIPSTQLPIDRGLMTVLPFGYKLSQMQGTQPATTYEMFVRLILREAARVLDIPLSLALGDTSGSNFSSARMEHLPYWRTRKVARQECEASTVEKTFRAWYEEASLIPGYLPRNAPPTPAAHRWFWDSAESIDPVKDATADQLELANGTETLADIYARRGEDWEQKMRQRARELKLARELGLAQEQASAPGKGGKTAAGDGTRKAVAVNGRSFRLRAGDPDQPRDEQGRFASKDTAHERRQQSEKDALDERQQAEADALDERHGRESDELSERHERATGERQDRQEAERDAAAEHEVDAVDERHEREENAEEASQDREKEALDRGQASEREAMESRHAAEQDDLEKQQEKETESRDKELTDKHERATADLEKQQEKEADQLEKQHYREEDKLSDKHAGESSRLEKQRDKEDEAEAKALDKQRGKEDASLEKKRDREDGALERRHESELEDTAALRDRQDAEIVSIKQEADQQVSRAADQAERQRLAVEYQDRIDQARQRHEAEYDAMQERNEKVENRQQAEQDALEKQREREDDERDARHAAEDKAREEAKTSRREKEDEADAARQIAEQAAMMDRQCKEQSDMEDRHAAEAEALENRQQEERRTYDRVGTALAQQRNGHAQAAQAQN
jgi:lambda family phage portal protein